VKVEVIDALLRRLRSGGDAVVSREEIGRLYERMVRSIGKLGLRRKPSETPFEYADRALPYLRDLETTLKTPLDTDTVATFTRQYTVIRYSNKGPVDGIELDREVATFLKHARYARIKRVLRRLRRQPETVTTAPADATKP
jgi:hypothetical protein